MLFVYFGSFFYLNCFIYSLLTFFISYFCPVTVLPIVRTFLLAKQTLYQQINKPINSIISSYQQMFTARNRSRKISFNYF